MSQSDSDREIREAIEVLLVLAIGVPFIGALLAGAVLWITGY